MDCVTCLLVGMCMLCEPGIYESNSQVDSGMDVPARSLTQEDINMALQKVLAKYKHDIERHKVTPSPRVGLNNRRSFYQDPKYLSFGIGKRKEHSLQDQDSVSGGYGATVNGRTEAALGRVDGVRKMLPAPRDSGPVEDGELRASQMFYAIPETLPRRLLSILLAPKIR